MAAQKRYKALNFDLDSKKLRDRFGESGRRKAYSQIKLFLTKNGFEHRQWSGYTSIRPMSYIETYDLVKELVISHEWLIDCVNRFDATNVMSETDMLDTIRSVRDDINAVPNANEIDDFDFQI